MRIAVVSDLHVGSNVGIMPRVVKGYDENEQRKMEYRASKVQQRILDQWNVMCHDVEGCDYLVANGDLCDGLNPKQKGSGNWTNDAQLQVDAAAELLEMVDAKRFIVTQGSQYHTGASPSLDGMVAKAVGAKFDDELVLTVKDTSFYFKHWVGVSSNFMYRPTPLAKEMHDTKLIEEDVGKIDVVVRSHAHYFTYCGFPHTFGVITPCWKGKDNFSRTRMNAFVPQLGWVVFDVEDDGYTWHYNVFTLKGSQVISMVS